MSIKNTMPDQLGTMSKVQQVEEGSVKEVRVTLDASELQKSISEALSKHLQELRRLLVQKEERKVVGEGEIGEGLQRLFEWMRSASTESLSGVPSTFNLVVDLLHELPSFYYDATEFFDVKEIPEGADTIKWFRLPPVSFSTTPEGTEVAEVSQSITAVSATPVERSARQVIRYSDLENSSIDLVGGMTRSLTIGALADSFKRAVDAISNDDSLPTIFGDGSVTSEASITPEMKLAPATLLQARKLIMDNAKLNPGVDLVALVSPKQYTDLLMHPDVKQLITYGSDEPVKRAEIPMIYGIKLYPFDVATGSGAGTPPVTTYRAIVFYAPPNPIERPIGLGIKRRLTIENVRDARKRQIDVVATYKDAVAVKDPKRIVRVITA